MQEEPRGRMATEEEVKHLIETLSLLRDKAPLSKVGLGLSNEINMLKWVLGENTLMTIAGEVLN